MKDEQVRLNDNLEVLSSDSTTTKMFKDLDSLYKSVTLPQSLNSFNLKTLYESVLTSESRKNGTLMEENKPKNKIFSKSKFSLSSKLYWQALRFGLVIFFVAILAKSLFFPMEVRPNQPTSSSGTTMSSCIDSQGRQYQAGRISTDSNGVPATQINLKQSLDGITVTVNSASADPNSINVFVTINAINCAADYELDKVSLVDAQGRVYEQLPSNLGTTNLGIGGSLVFDASSITDKPSALELHLSIGSIGRHYPTGKFEQLDGPLNFDFSVPFNTNTVRIDELHQSVTAGGVTTTLEKVIITPTQTRIFIDNIGADPSFNLQIGDDFFISNDMTNSKKNTNLGSIELSETPDGIDIILNMSLYDKKGMWSLTLNAPKFASGTPTTGGPWVFHFQS